MAEEIQVQDDQEIHVELGQENPEGDTESQEIAEGYNYLLKEDLDPETEPTQETISEEDNQSAQAEKSESTKDTADTDSSNAEVYKINGTEYTADELTTRMTKDYENLASFTGKQAEQIGALKAEIDRMKGANAEIPETEVNTDVEEKETSYDIYTEDGLKKMTQDIARKAFLEEQNKLSQAREQENFTTRAKDAREVFNKNHPEYSEKDTVDLVNWGVENGLGLTDGSTTDSIAEYLELVHAVKNKDFSSMTNKGDDQNIEKVKEAQKVKSGLSNVGGSDKTEVDYDNMSPKEWAALPKEKRMELLGL